jgi:ring-1,2-phenylacetyl-CoA epoxidase subunit PaaC
MTPQLKESILIMADNSMILGQRIGEWCGHGPILEQDIALTNIALDLIGEARYYYQMLAEIEGKMEDDYPMLRDAREFRNVLLVEQPNGHWGDTIVRQCLFDVFHYHFLLLLPNVEEKLANIAAKCIKEAKYHLSFSSEWLIRLADGTEESHRKMQDSLNNLYPFFGEFFEPSESESYCIESGILPDYGKLKEICFSKIEEIVLQSTLYLPSNISFRHGGKKGLHSEYLGYILADMQYLQRSFPGAQW